MSGAGYIPPPGGYPSGPETCANRTDCTPIIQAFNQPLTLLAPLYTAAATVLLVLLVLPVKNAVSSWRLRAKCTGGRAENRARLLGGEGQSAGGAEQQLNGGICIAGYVESAFGRACYCLILGFTAAIVGVYLVVIVDFYWACEFTGPDNCCLQGAHPVFGDYNVNSKVMFGWWTTTMLWASILGYYKGQVRNWCRTRSTLDEAEWVWLAAPCREQDLSVKPSRAGKCIVRIYRSLVASSGFEETVPVQTTGEGRRFFVFMCQRFVIDDEGEVCRPEDAVVAAERHTQLQARGLSSSEHRVAYEFLGPNCIPFAVDSLGVAMAKEFLSPFYLYQLLIYSTWIWSSWLLVGSVLAGVVIGSGFLNIWMARQNQESIRRLTLFRGTCEVKRDDRWKVTNTVNLVPGDVVSLGRGDVPCDCMIICGVAGCDESMLTGESMPARKVAISAMGIQEQDEGNDVNPRHMLFAGSKILHAGQGRSEDDHACRQDRVICVVTATGINTSKGQLVSSILFPTRLTFTYDVELVVVIGILALYATGVVCAAVVFLQTNGSEMPFVTTWAYATFTASQTLSPLLPVALRTGEQNASKRLSSAGIFCLNPKRIAIAGKVRVFCFDKTGTLTLEGLEFRASQWCGDGSFASGASGEQTLDASFYASAAPASISPSFNPPISDATVYTQQQAPIHVLRGMACCHAVTVAPSFSALAVDEASGGTVDVHQELSGNEVEVRMLRASGWSLIEGQAEGLAQLVSPLGDDCLEVLARNEFDHHRMTMSVIVRTSNGARFVYCKGAFEKVKQLCLPQSLPTDFDSVANEHASTGNYVLALAVRQLEKDEADTLVREDAEKDLTFVSLLLFRNELKHDTHMAIKALRQGDVRPVMITGDTAPTGCFIAKECGMVDTTTQLLLAESVAYPDPYLDPAGTGVVWKWFDKSSSADTLNTDTVKQLVADTSKNGNLELAMTGDAFAVLVSSGDIHSLLLHTRVFARMSPSQKMEVIGLHQVRGLIVGMCGDGGNDCGALSSAHVGLALSDAEASLVSPFTSRSKSCVSCVDLLREGRGALATSFASYRFLMQYGCGFSCIKLFGYYYGIILSAAHYIAIDIVIVISMTYCITLAKPLPDLGVDRPTASLLGPTTIAAVFGQHVINVFFLGGAIAWLNSSEDYIRWGPNDDNVVPPRPVTTSEGRKWWYLGNNWETTTLFLCFSLQLITAAVVHSLGARKITNGLSTKAARDKTQSVLLRPDIFTLAGGRFRLPIWRNKWLCMWSVGLYALFVSLLLTPPSKFAAVFHIASIDFNSPGTANPVWQAYQDAGGQPSSGMSFDFRVKLFAIFASGNLVALAWEMMVVQGPVRTMLRQSLPAKIHHAPATALSQD